MNVYITLVILFLHFLHLGLLLIEVFSAKEAKCPSHICEEKGLFSITRENYCCQYKRFCDLHTKWRFKGNFSLKFRPPSVHSKTAWKVTQVTYLYIGRFIMFSTITNIYNKKTKGPTLIELFTTTRKLDKFFWQIETFDMCTTGETVRIDRYSNSCHTRVKMGASIFFTAEMMRAFRYGLLQRWRMSMHPCWRVCGCLKYEEARISFFTVFRDLYYKK
jgi:hypothetical protein